MHKLNIRSRARKRKMYRKLEEMGIYHRYPNVLNRDFAATTPTRSGSRILPIVLNLTGLGVPVYHQRPIRWLYCGS